MVEVGVDVVGQAGIDSFFGFVEIFNVCSFMLIVPCLYFFCYVSWVFLVHGFILITSVQREGMFWSRVLSVSGSAVCIVSFWIISMSMLVKDSDSALSLLVDAVGYGCRQSFFWFFDTLNYVVTLCLFFWFWWTCFVLYLFRICDWGLLIVFMVMLSGFMYIMKMAAGAVRKFGINVLI